MSIFGLYLGQLLFYHRPWNVSIDVNSKFPSIMPYNDSMAKIHQFKPDPVPMTQAGFDEAMVELERLEKYREEVLVRLQAAREMGDLSENGAYKAARFELSDTDRNIKRLKFIKLYGEVSTPTQNNVVELGNTVTLDTGKGEVTYTLVSRFEADPKEKKISVISPLGKVVMGAKVGDEVIMNVPAGEQKFRVKKII